MIHQHLQLKELLVHLEFQREAAVAVELLLQVQLLPLLLLVVAVAQEQHLVLLQVL
tara:strand:- start:125 stop:292 length:168 start_codon:yes stop_codon:yes gene_type:complete